MPRVASYPRAIKILFQQRRFKKGVGASLTNEASGAAERNSSSLNDTVVPARYDYSARVSSHRSSASSIDRRRCTRVRDRVKTRNEPDSPGLIADSEKHAIEGLIPEERASNVDALRRGGPHARGSSYAFPFALGAGGGCMRNDGAYERERERKT